MAIERHWNMERTRTRDAFKRFLLRMPSPPAKLEFPTDMVLDPRSGYMVAATQRKANDALCFERLDRALQTEAVRFNTIVNARALSRPDEDATADDVQNNVVEMANIEASLAAIMQLPGAIGVAVVDLESGLSLGSAGGGAINLDIAAAGNTEVVRAKIRVMQALNLQDEIEDILITLGKQYHIIRPLTGNGSAGLFLYAALNKSKANLAMTRLKLTEIAQSINL